MPQEPTTPDLEEAVRRSAEAFDRRDFDGVLAIFRPDAVLDASPMGGWAFEGGKAIRGFREDRRGPYEEFEREWVREWDDIRAAEVEEYRELDDERVPVLHRLTGRGKSSGLAVEQTQPKVAGLFHIRNRKVTRHVAYARREDAFADLGLKE